MRISRNNTNLIFILLLLVLPVIFYFYFKNKNEEYRAITTFEECVSRGYPLSETYPEECMVPGKRFPNPLQKKAVNTSVTEKEMLASDLFLNESYIFEGQTIKLSNGKMEQTEPKSVAPLLEYVPGSETKSDINEDGKEDTVFTLKNTANRDAVWYLTALVTLHNGVLGLNIVPIASKVSTTTITYSDGKIIAKYNMTTGAPQSKTYALKDGILIEMTATSTNL